MANTGKTGHKKILLIEDQGEILATAASTPRVPMVAMIIESQPARISEGEVLLRSCIRCGRSTKEGKVSMRIRQSRGGKDL